ncbi:hypothetical protein NQ315_017044 [Exocentrus adspersus]|uniref:Uncharacterized protein n=1 Tax=Exocentrus adspersus TaxID=1586481 RepID=A0AAV8V8S4_9CUCU|nr:hypothetical protein NQ315_017044 [Exocentrus adspersus]
MANFQIVFLVAIVSSVYTQISTDNPTTDLPETTTTPNPGRSFSIRSSNAPDPQYEWDAVQCLSEAYVHFPGSLDSVIVTFGQLYKLKYRQNWYVSAGCNSVYNPKSRITIVVNVNEGLDVTPICLFN